MPNRQKEKGTRGERELQRYLDSRGIEAKRIPLSGAVRGFEGDLAVEFDVFPMSLDEQKLTGKWEIKRMAQGFKKIYGWLKDNKVVAFRGDRQEWLVTMKLDDLLDTVGAPKQEDSPSVAVWKKFEAYDQMKGNPAPDKTNVPKEPR